MVDNGTDSRPAAPAATKPVTLASIVGHGAAAARLRRALERNSLHHALLLTGPEGIGKATLARALAMAGLCPVTPHQGCGSCPTCHRVHAGLHTDFVVTKGAGKSQSISKSVCDTIVERCQSAPLEAELHFELIDPADRLTREAANALLKTLEEPNPGVYFILIAANARRVLATIRSRCLEVPLHPLAQRDLERVLTDVLASSHEGEALDPVTIGLAQGSPGVALELAHNPATRAARAFVDLAIAAVEAPRGGAQVFAGDSSPLWSAWTELTQLTPDPDQDSEGEDEPNPVTVIKKAGRKARPAKKTGKKRASKRSGSTKASPAVQRAAARQVASLWQLLVREALASARVSASPTEAQHKLAQLERLQSFDERLDRNPNVRLAMETMFIDLCRDLCHPEPPRSVRS